MKLKKSLIIVVILIIILIIISFFIKPKTETNKTVEIVTIPVDQTSLKDVIKLNWKIENAVLPKEMVIWGVKDKTIDDDFINKITSLFGFKNEPEVNDGSLLVFNNNSNFTNLDINKDTNTIKYSKDLLLNKMEKVENVVDEKIIEDNLMDMILKNFAIDNKITLVVGEKSYEDIVEPRFVTTEKNLATIIHFKIGYKFNNYPVYSEKGFPIDIRTSLDGTILSFSIDLPFDVGKETGILKIKDFSEIKNTSLDKFKIFTVTGNQDFDRSMGDEKIVESNVTDIKSGYIYQVGQNEIKPYLFLTGDSTLPSYGKVNTDIILSAESTK